jgi:hypothetical protein
MNELPEGFLIILFCSGSGGMGAFFFPGGIGCVSYWICPLGGEYLKFLS